ncbi:MAG: hypothetical protein K2G36_05440 [Ruminococcus sp.]|nr:hypothetical protein [Ruminococcus sp.]
MSQCAGWYFKKKTDVYDICTEAIRYRTYCMANRSFIRKQHSQGISYEKDYGNESS